VEVQDEKLVAVAPKYHGDSELPLVILHFVFWRPLSTFLKTADLDLSVFLEQIDDCISLPFNQNFNNSKERGLMYSSGVHICVIL